LYSNIDEPVGMFFVLLLLETFALIVVGYFAVPAAPFFMVLWIIALCGLQGAARRGWFPELTTPQRCVHQSALVVIPIVITGWLRFEEARLIDHAGFPNRVQHFVWAMAMAALMIPVFARWWGQVHRVERVVMAVAVVVMLGCAAEVFEYETMSAGVATQPGAGFWVWRDTMLDFIMNGLGAALVALVVSGAQGNPIGGRKQTALVS
jgi:hypothetical protein